MHHNFRDLSRITILNAHEFLEFAHNHLLGMSTPGKYTKLKYSWISYTWKSRN